MPLMPDALRARISAQVADYYAAAFLTTEFIPGVTPVPVAGRVFDAHELQTLVEASLDFWLTTGRFAAQFEVEFSRWFAGRQTVLVNSGSSANLLALAALTSPTLGDRRLCAGDEVITAAVGFPTTVNPILQNQLVPVFIDAVAPSYNADPAQLARALSPKTKAIMLAHTLGNPLDLEPIVAFARQHHLWLIEDCCDALGSTYHGQPVGTFGDIATVSFYPAHHITMGEGGAVITGDAQLKKLLLSFRDWGRDCWCDPGKDDTCRRRFDWQVGELPYGYDHKYTYAHIGYNLKATDLQAAVGVAQLAKLAGFIDARRRNFATLHAGLQDLQEVFLLPEATPGSAPSWFGFPLAVRPEAPVTREQLIRYLEARKIGTRLLFGGNLTRQPAYRDVAQRTVGALPLSDFVMNQVFWLGVYPGLTPPMLAYMLDCLHAAVAAHV